MPNNLQAIQSWAVTHPRLLALSILGGLLLVFILQNMAAIELTFLFWTFQSRRIVVIAISLVVGGLLGWLYGYDAGRKAAISPDTTRQSS